jgi:hypothetical protein
MSPGVGEGLHLAAVVHGLLHIVLEDIDDARRYEDERKNCSHQSNERKLLEIDACTMYMCA